MAVYPIRNCSALRHPVTDDYVVPRAGQPYAEDDALVVAFPWAFCTAEAFEEAAAAAAEPVVSVPIERATARPGEKRRMPTRRGR